VKNRYDVLKLENQLCFPIYACAREIVKKYKPFLDKIDLTYTQYITMMVIWEREKLNVKELGRYLYLDSGTLTPVLKRLESKGYITRTRSKDDERNLLVALTDRGGRLKEQAVEIPMQLGKCVKLKSEEAGQLYNLLYKMLNDIAE
jgi:DNA-binding MarR family transcriptional regulator